MGVGAQARGRVGACLSIRVVRPSCFLPIAPFIAARPGVPWCHKVADLWL